MDGDGSASVCGVQLVVVIVPVNVNTRAGRQRERAARNRVGVTSFHAGVRQAIRASLTSAKLDVHGEDDRNRGPAGAVARVGRFVPEVVIMYGSMVH